VNTNRNFIGMELDETYFNIAKERIEKHLQKLKKKRGNDNEFKEG
jgi:DNA modification methylase